MARPHLVSCAMTLAVLPLALAAQVIREPASAAQGAPRPLGAVDATVARSEQAAFERFRVTHLPPANVKRPSNCEETVGRFCYWYDETAPALPKEPQAIADRRTQLVALLDTVARESSADRWISGQRVRYLAESERLGEALSAARECTTGGWWCDVLVGFSLHVLGEYVAADSVYAVALTKMTPHDRCAWRSIELLVDDDTRQQYRRHTCDDPTRDAFEDRAWFFARTLYAQPGNDSRTEHFARMTMTLMLEDAAGPYEFGFDEDERELLLRFGWPRAWAATQAPTSTLSLNLPRIPG
ncbi:MAG: hypothetical protein ACHQU1_12965, partial [Gemmatimonadales bacterium]